MSAARHADVLLVKLKADGENDLATYCKNEGIPFTTFTEFSRALLIVQSVVSGERTPQEVLDEGTALFA